jgi:protocatechuate 4,5-dioxygenase alpha chain
LDGLSLRRRRRDLASRTGPESPRTRERMMAWEKLDLTLASHDLIQDLKWDPRLRERFKRDEASVLDQYDLKPEERRAIEQRDFRRLYDLGIHPYLGGQLSRLIYGNDAGKGAIEAADKLVASLTGTEKRNPG